MTRAKPAAQSRSQEKLQRILQAMESLLAQKPFESITIGDIAAAAGISPATIYQRFRNEDAAGAILLELYFQRAQDWAARPKNQRPDVSLHGSLLAIGEDAWDQAAGLGHIMRPAYLYSRRWPERAGEDWKRLEAMATKGFEAFVGRHDGEITLTDPKAAAATMGLTINMMLAALLLHGGDGAPSPLHDRETFSTELASLVYRYLTPATERTR